MYSHDTWGYTLLLRYFLYQGVYMYTLQILHTGSLVGQD